MGQADYIDEYYQALDRWFDARTFYGAEGRFPNGITSALRAMPGMFARMETAVREIAPRRALEIGPGDRPVIASVPEPHFLDLVPGFLRALKGRRTVGDIRRAPFRADAFDLVVCNDVFTHLPIPDRPGALAEIARMAPRALIFNPEPGTEKVVGSSVPTEDLVRVLEARGLECATRTFQARLPGREYTMKLVTATRRQGARAAAESV